MGTDVVASSAGENPPSVGIFEGLLFRFGGVIITVM